MKCREKKLKKHRKIIKKYIKTITKCWLQLAKLLNVANTFKTYLTFFNPCLSFSHIKNIMKANLKVTDPKVNSSSYLKGEGFLDTWMFE